MHSTPLGNWSTESGTWPLLVLWHWTSSARICEPIIDSRCAYLRCAARAWHRPGNILIREYDQAKLEHEIQTGEKVVSVWNSKRWGTKVDLRLADFGSDFTVLMPELTQAPPPIGR